MYPDNINERYLDEIVEKLNDGAIIIYPTDTLYAIGCDAFNNNAIERLCKLRDINPQKQTLSIICSDCSMASNYARIDNETFRILKHNLPGPFTFILPASTKLPKVFKGRKQVGIRIPDDKIAIALTERLGHPMFSASIMIDEDITEFNPRDLDDSYTGIADILIDDGIERYLFIPSTIVDLSESHNPEIIREGKGELQ